MKKTITDEIGESILYLGWLNRANLGDEALWEVFAQMFAHAEQYHEPAKMLLRFAKISDRFHIGHIVRKALRRRQRAAFAKSKGPVVLGGGTLIGARIWLPVVQDALAAGRRLHTFGTGVMDMKFWAGRFGYPLEASDYMAQWATALSRFDSVSVRGVQSKRLLDGLGVRCKVVGDPIVTYVASQPVRLPGRKVIGINVGDARRQLWAESEQAVCNIMRSVADSLGRKGWEVRIFSVCPNDTALCRKWMSTLSRGDEIPLIAEHRYPVKYIAKVQQCDLFVGMKLHATALAFISQVPSIMLEYRPKCADFMETMEAQDRNLHTNNLDPKQIEALIEHVYMHKDGIREQQHEISMRYAKQFGAYFAGLGLDIGID